MSATLSIGLGPMQFNNLYAPHEGYKKIEKQFFWDQVDDFARYNKRNARLLIGDLNARVQGRDENEEDVLGEHTWGMGYEYLGDNPRRRRVNRDAMINVSISFFLYSRASETDTLRVPKI